MLWILKVGSLNVFIKIDQFFFIFCLQSLASKLIWIGLFENMCSYEAWCEFSSDASGDDLGVEDHDDDRSKIKI